MAFILRAAVAQKRASLVVSKRCFAEAASSAPASAMTLNLCTPHAAIYKNKVVDKVLLPGESGEYGVTVGHSPVISQLKPGVVTVIHAAVIMTSLACTAQNIRSAYRKSKFHFSLTSLFSQCLVSSSARARWRSFL